MQQKQKFGFTRETDEPKEAVFSELAFYGRKLKEDSIL